MPSTAATPGCCVAEYLDQPVAPYTVDQTLTHGDVLRLGEADWQVVATPGHTPGHICLWQPEKRRVATVHPTCTPLRSRTCSPARAPRPRPGVLLPADLNNEDDDGNGWTLLERDQFDPGVVFPGAVLMAGRPGGSGQAQVLRTELFLTTGGEVAVLVTFRQTRLRSLKEALGEQP
jgi:hypothetical protein